MLLRRHSTTAALVLAVSLLAACDSTEPLPRAHGVDFAAVPDTLGVGDSVALAALPLDAASHEIHDATLTWASRAPSVVAVTPSGAATALATGDAWLVATVGGSARGVDSLRMHVVPESRSLRLAAPRDSVTPYETVALQASVDASLGRPIAPGTLRFSSSDTLIARVDSLTGEVLVEGDGDVTITVTDGARRASTTLHSWLTTIETGGVRLAQVTIGWGFGCGLDAQGAAYCWGANNQGQLGRGTRLTGTEMLPFGPVSTSTRFSAISAGRGGACGLTLAGGVECWGTRTLTGLSLQLSLDQRTVPVAVALPQGAGRIVRIDVGTRGPLCAIDEAGANYCFGDNWYGAIGGIRGMVTELRPVPGSPATGLQSIGTGELHGCGTTTAGALWCWGDGGSWSLSTSWYQPDPTRVAGIPAVRDVVAGFQTTCALAADGIPWCGGIVGSADRDWSDFRPLAMLPGAAPFVRLEGGTEYTCGLTADGDASCWAHGHPALTPFLFRATQPVPLSRRERFVDVGAGPSGVCGVTTEGLVRCLTFRLAFQ